MAPLKTASRILCHRHDGTKTYYYVEGCLSAKKKDIEAFTPWVLNGSSLPRSIDLDQCIINRHIRLFATLQNDSRIPIRDILCVIPSENREEEVDLQVRLWLDFQELQNFAPHVLATYDTKSCMYSAIFWDPTMLTIIPKDSAVDFQNLPSFRRYCGKKPAPPVRRSARIQAQGISSGRARDVGPIYYHDLALY